MTFIKLRQEVRTAYETVFIGITNSHEVIDCLCNVQFPVSSEDAAGAVMNVPMRIAGKTSIMRKAYGMIERDKTRDEVSFIKKILRQTAYHVNIIRQ